ncbi:MAG: c-type cytochrome [Planctomycetota bacterium]
MKKPVVVAIGVAGLIILVVVVVMMLRKGGPKPGSDILVELRPKPGDPESAVDPMYGRTMYDQNCTACHGWRGEGDGPSDPYLWRRPRNIADGSYMNGRSDEQLLDVLGNGGRDSKSQLSRIMPAWSTTFNAHQQDDILAWVRRLHPNIPDFVAAGDWTRHESVLTPARADQVKSKSGSELAPGDATVTVFAVWSDVKGRARQVDEPVPAPDTAGLAGYVAFTRIPVAEGKQVSIGVAIDKAKKVHKAAVFEQVVLLKGKERDTASVDTFLKSFEGADAGISGVNPPVIAGRDELSKVLGDSVKRLYWRLVLGIEQDIEDWADIKAGKMPNASHPGREIYDRMKCAECHGPTARSKGPGVAKKEFVAANLADGARMNDLTDQYLFDLLENGGPAMNISGVMPSYSSQLSKDEMKTLIEYIRTLTTEKKK